MGDKATLQKKHTLLPPREPLVPLPSKDFWWCETDPDLFTLFKGELYTGIMIRWLNTGSYIVRAGEYPITEVPTEHQAQAIGNNIALAFADNLPGYKNTGRRIH